MKRTKIVCTIGPACNDVEILKQMIKAGMNVARFNMSHGTHASHHEMIEKVKQARKARYLEKRNELITKYLEVEKEIEIILEEERLLVEEWKAYKKQQKADKKASKTKKK